jgi:hypothetical protein
MNKLLIGFILGILVTGIATKILIDNSFFRLAYCNWDAVEKIWKR